MLRRVDAVCSQGVRYPAQQDRDTTSYGIVMHENPPVSRCPTAATTSLSIRVTSKYSSGLIGNIILNLDLGVSPDNIELTQAPRSFIVYIKESSALLPESMLSSFLPTP